MKPLSVFRVVLLPLLGGLGLGVWAQQNNSVDPTMPLGARFSQLGDGTDSQVLTRSFQLQAIFIKEDRQYAIVNDTIVSVGDSVEGATVTQIASDSVQITTNINGRETQRRLALINQSDIKKHVSDSY